ncbi:sensor histidine kinase [Nocardioides sp. AX2bis]|uniref:sensor histidine kinase n=1 Tax=Nocardioides sp. AX2bis TaxID=2653157 RepID=UPI00135ADCA5|nr:HAMP domain-containing sensor histidine kinase [Nocardioides sp. AX2bis]
MPDRKPAHPEERYRSLFVHHPHAVFLLDLTGSFAEVNPACARISGRTVEDLLGSRFADLVEPGDVVRAEEAFARALRDELPRVELAVRHRDGRVLDIDVSGIRWLVDGEVRGVYGVAQDVTERKQVARDLVVTQQLAAEASQAKTDFAARMSHELRTPLTSILATVELLTTTDDTTERDELMAVLQRAGSRLRTLVDGVLDFAAAGTARPEQEVVDLHATARDAVARVAERAHRKGLQVDLDVAEDVPRLVRDHPRWTAQILAHLLDNAIEHTPLGRVGLTVSTTTSASAGPGVLYRVSDTGVGIDLAQQEQVFEAFHQGDPATGGAGGGTRTGLGLSTVKQLVSISGGDIALASAPGRGSTFFVTMPVEPVVPDDSRDPVT